MTQKEIARQLNITQASVSLALKGSSRISPTLRTTVLTLAQKGNYRPNLAGQLLRRGKSNVVGAVFPSLVNGFYGELFQELQKQLLPHGYLLTLCQADSPVEQKAAADYLRQLQVAGVIAIGSAAEAMLPLRGEGIALVFYGGDSNLEYAVSQILPERYQAGLEMTRYLRNCGRKRIAFLGATTPEEPRFRGYRDALAEAGLEVLTVPAVSRTDSMDRGFSMMKQLCRTNPGVDAVFAHNDSVAIGALRAAMELRIPVPEKIAVAGFDCIDAGRYFSPALTTVEQPRHEIVTALVTELFASMRDQEHHNLVSIPCRLVIRESA
ncbi:MAG: LacI family DNA-binding transcriptional regulator [Lentisphaeria bacterium]|nr:LacI family DNA-binding transcriptional regulator [Lentisphaeria bacterium]